MYWSPSAESFSSNEDTRSDNVYVLDEVHNNIMAQLTAGKRLADDGFGNPTVVDIVIEPPVLTVSDIFSARLQSLNFDFEIAARGLHNTYPFSETATWTTQLAEANAYRAWEDDGSVGDPPATPFITALNTTRTTHGVGDGLSDLVTRIITNSAAFTPAMASIVGRRHAAELALHTAYNNESITELNAVTWDFSV